MSKRLAVLLGMLITAIWPLAAIAQETTSPAPTLSVPYPGISVEPGDRTSFDVFLTDFERRQFALEVQGVPTEWTSSFRGGGSDIYKITATPESVEIDLILEIPFDATDGSYPLTVVASADDGTTVSVGVELVVEEGIGGEVTLTPDFPELTGSSEDTFEFSVEVANSTAEDVQLELVASGPTGWQVTARPSGESQASVLVVEANSNQDVDVEANTFSANAGEYTVNFGVVGEEIDLQVPLIVNITGEPSIQLTTTDQLLSNEVSAGQPTELLLFVINDGTTVLRGVEMDSFPPQNWEVTFEPQVIDEIQPEGQVEVIATMTPASNAIAGDYIVTFNAEEPDGVRDSIDLRSTVNASALLLLISLGIFVVVLLGVILLFRRYGRL